MNIVLIKIVLMNRHERQQMDRQRDSSDRQVDRQTDIGIGS